MTTKDYTKIELPPTWEGSAPEYLCYTTLIKLGKAPMTDFTFQTPLLGGRAVKGGSVIDFMFSNPSDLAINVQGVYYHYEMGLEVKARDIMARAQLAGEGRRLIFVDDDDLLRDPEWHVKEALQYKDHSRIGRLGG